jgi:hypothetical protein
VESLEEWHLIDELWGLKKQNVIKLMQWNTKVLKVITEEVQVSRVDYFHVY